MKAKHIFIFVSLSVNLLFSLPAKAQKDTLQYKPDVKINVNVQRDDNGNIIGYDSTYVETWTSDGQKFNSDSIISSHFKTFSDIDINNDMFFNFPGFVSPNDSTFSNMFSFPEFCFPNDSVLEEMFSFPDIDKLRDEMFSKMKQYNNSYKPSVEEQKKEQQPVKKEKSNLNTIDI